MEGAHEAFNKWLPVGKSLFWRSTLSRDLLDDFLQDAFLRFLIHYVDRKIPVNDPGAVLTTILLNLIRNNYRRSKPQRLGDFDLVDPSSQAAKEIEEREHRKHLIDRILQAATPEERRAGEAFIASDDDNEKAVDLLLDEDGVTAPSFEVWWRKHKTYTTNLSRLRIRARFRFQPNE